MAVLEISFPSGFVVNMDTLNGLVNKIDLIKKVETRDGDTVAIIYFDHLTQDVLNLSLDGSRLFAVSQQKPSSVIIYDYYDNCKYFVDGILFVAKCNNNLFPFE